MLLRRHHAAGDVLHSCLRGDTVVTGEDLKQPVTITVRGTYDERLLAVTPRGYEMRVDTISGSAHMVVDEHEPRLTELSHRVGTSVEIDKRNRKLGVELTSEDEATDVLRLNFTPYVNNFDNVTYPEHAVRKNQTFGLRVRDTVQREDAMPTQLAIDVTFTVREITAKHVELACKGTHVESAQSGKTRAANELAITCRVLIDRRDGRTSRWWIEANGKTTWPESEPMFVRAHYDMVVGKIADAAGVCERAREPTPRSAGG